ncbi:MAG TPA: glycosyltransferase [Tepidisphaeraceae bacterium]|nr:glycosyltransferase [Tepidisphaeraceae bacterium]
MTRPTDAPALPSPAAGAPEAPAVPELSIVIPAYNEAHKIAKDVAAAAQFLIEQRMSGEVIVSDDGSRDGTADVARATAVPAGVELHVIAAERNRGKGAAVRAGMTAARGTFVMFADSGVCIPYEQALRGLALLKAGKCEVAHASRKRQDSVIINPQPFHRRVFSRVFRVAANWVLRLPHGLTDTQCGFKMYAGDVARAVYGELRTDGFLFDLETILRAIRRGYRIAEFPVTWSCDPDTRLHAGRTAVRTVAELRAIKRYLGEGTKDAGGTASAAPRPPSS